MGQGGGGGGAEAGGGGASEEVGTPRAAQGGGEGETGGCQEERPGAKAERKRLTPFLFFKKKITKPDYVNFQKLGLLKVQQRAV